MFDKVFAREGCLCTTGHADMTEHQKTCSVNEVAAACNVEGSPAAATVQRLSQASPATDCSPSSLASIFVTAARRLHGDIELATAANGNAAFSVAIGDE